MGKRNIPLVSGEIYHVYNRGVDKRIIFSNKQEFGQFLEYLDLCRFDIKLLNYQELGHDYYHQKVGEYEQLVEIICFCLLDNHYHMIIKQVADDGISKFMQRLGTAYTMYFNAKHNRSGSLFQGKFKSSHIDSDSYFQHVTSYVCANYIVHPKKKYVGCYKDIFSKEELICSKDLFGENTNINSFIKYSEDRIRMVYKNRLLIDTIEAWPQ